MAKYIEKHFPVAKLNPITSREAAAMKPIYQLHKWWARRVGSAFRMILLTSFLEVKDEEEARQREAALWEQFFGERDAPQCKGKLVLDPFMGGGVTVIEALRLGCRVIGIDLNPVAWFITKKEVELGLLTEEEFDAAVKHLEETVAPEILRWYRTTCPHCGEQADVMYVFWVKKVTCRNPECGAEVRLFSDFRLSRVKDEQGRMVELVFCPRCYHQQTTRDMNAELECEECGQEYVPSEGWVSDGHYVCPVCGQGDETVKWAQAVGRPPDIEMYAIEYWCPHCKTRDYKPADDFDRKLYEEACAEFERVKDELPLPEQEIPPGAKTAEPLNHGYRRFRDLFNPRQLLCLGRLYRAILDMPPGNLQEVLLVTLSDALNANSMQCSYLVPVRKIERAFALHAYWVPDRPCENNVWGTAYGRGTFAAYARKTRRALAWVRKPGERPLDKKILDKAPPGATAFWTEKEIAELHPRPDNGVGRETVWEVEAWDGERPLLLCGTSEDMSFLDDESVDAIITDPPYYDNVMYSELADFFYVWLRIGLKNRYPRQFGPELTPKAREIVKNEARGKDDEAFLDGLRRVFGECERVLKPEGVMAFTFHHARAEAWARALKTLLDAKFEVVRVWPYRSEHAGSIHREGIKFDTIIVCRKREREPAPIAWATLQDRIYEQARETVDYLTSNGAALAEGDVFVVAMGHTLELLTQHWPNITHEGRGIDIAEALGDIEKMIDMLLPGEVPRASDALTRIYVRMLAGRKRLAWDEVQKRAQYGGVEPRELQENRLVEHRRASAYPLDAEARAEYLERLANGDRLALDVDWAQYLRNEYAAGRQIDRWLDRVPDRERIATVCEALHQKTKDKSYMAVAQRLRARAEAPRLEFEDDFRESGQGRLEIED